MNLNIKNVSKSYRDTVALDDVNLNLTCGIYAILGPNGSGKTTLLNILTRNIIPDSGTVTYEDDSGEIDIAANEAFYFSRLGYVPQNPAMYPDFNAADYLKYIAALKGISDIETQVKHVLNLVELSDASKKKIKTLSGGMKQRLDIAQALLGSPSLLIFDEPTAGLDPEQRIKFKNLIAALSADKTVMISTHIVSDIEDIANTVIILKSGRVYAADTPDNLLEQMKNKVWVWEVPSDLFSTIQYKYQVVNMSRNGKICSLRILSDDKPSCEATPANPTLDDYYFYVFGNRES